LGILTEIVESKREELENIKRNKKLDELKTALSEARKIRDFKSAVSNKGVINLIAEIKRRSPSIGIIRKDLDIKEISKIYEENGAKAISVLTDQQYFYGSLEDLRIVKETTSLPILRKDFIIDPYQIYESRVWGADCILLIASILEDSQLEDFIALSRDLGMASLVEVHSTREVDRVLSVSSEIIGINNRNLNDFTCDLETTLKLVKDIPGDKIKVSESGIRSSEEVKNLKEAGIDAILVGEGLLKSPNIGEKMRELIL